ncbi:MAG: 3-isopropylmalate dehydratase small subunit [Anaerobiospirillum succiniciproducens]|uniref:3-isopropylmalate dehydratase small subunit n=1 Tax=Anaerobiospirillum succiniciproducens TaxID=13335 RepID=UPI002352D39C|nr:3-isopropylmalate dehydratase small subunit [Anaerobiospirillum succiniciproducens]MCI6863481.1 3-isopropylmalate dehydratase small subunit [Anaerobiospirillum succiniciproducens]MDY2798928.1 3-isopropylmalate dehydratase small subunit [Anaerobiospirillum succiniciproducens]
MEKFTVHTGVAVPLNSANIDTDQIIPKQFLLATTRKGFGKHAFHDWRYLDDAETQLNPDFNLNKKEYQGASVLVAQDNFGNGSSREHAPWALTDFGFRAVIAPSFANIFNKNALGNGLLTVKLKGEEVNELITYLEQNAGASVTISLEEMYVQCGDKRYSFDLEPFYRNCLLNGLDNIDLTLEHSDAISAYEKSSTTWNVGTN